jgi:hypothetical protein
MEDSTFYQMVLEKGAGAELKKVLLVLGTKQFGTPDAPIAATIEGITDLARLEALSQRLLDVGSWQELLDLPRPRRRPGGRRERPG